ncbi:MAG: hypothetical protein KY460_04075 [Actinobacteria bacterium]|nr:hypothetical protein [Actinomycetota bacterium]
MSHLTAFRPQGRHCRIASTASVTHPAATTARELDVDPLAGMIYVMGKGRLLDRWR